MEFNVRFLLLALLLSSFAFATWDDTSRLYRIGFTTFDPQTNNTNTTTWVKLNSSNFNYSLAQPDLSDVKVYCEGSQKYAMNVSINTSGNSYILISPDYSHGEQCYVYFGNSTTATPAWNLWGVGKIYANDFNNTAGFSVYPNGALSCALTTNSTVNCTNTGASPASYIYQTNNQSVLSLLIRERINYATSSSFQGLAFQMENPSVLKHYRWDSDANTMRLQLVTLGGAESNLGSASFTDTLGQYYVFRCDYFSWNVGANANGTCQVLDNAGVWVTTTDTTLTATGAYGFACYGAAGTANCEADWMMVLPKTVFAGNGTNGDSVGYNFLALENQSGVTASQSFQATDYESNATNFNLTATVLAGVSNVQPVALEWNGTNYTSGFSNASSGSNYSFGKILNISLLDNNASVVGVRWFYNVTFTNGSTYEYITTNSSQTLLFAYNVSNFSLTSNSVVQGGAFTANTSLYNASILAGSITDIKVSMNGVNYSMTQYGNSNYSVGLNAPSTLGSYTLFSWFNFTFNGVTKTRYSGNQILSVVGVVLYACNGTYPLLLNFTFAGEENRQALNASMNATFTVWSSSTRVANSNYTFNWVNVSSASICVSTAGTYNVDSFQTYIQAVVNSTGYQRDFFLYNFTASTTSPPLINLITANASFAKLLKITSMDSTNIPLVDYLVSAYRYYPELNQYILVAMAQTDSLGLSNTYLTPNDVWYRFVLFSKTTGNVSIFTPQQIQCDPVASYCTLTLQVKSNYGNFFNWFGGLGYSCSVDTTANSTSCTIQDNSGSFSSFTLTLYQVGLIQTNTLCSNTLTGSSGTVVCTFNDSGLHTWILKGSNGALITSGSFNTATQSATYGASGLLLTFLLFITIAFIASYSLSASLLAGAFSLMLAAVLGLFIADLTLLGTVLIIAVLVGVRLKS